MPAQKRTIGGVEYAYRIAGAAEARPILLLHGLTANLRDWAFNTKPLADAGWRVLTPDLPGHGGTSAPPAPSAYALTAVADGLHALAGELGFLPCVVAGHSMGGAVAEEYAIRHGGDVAALVLVDSAGGDPRRAPPPAAKFADLAALERKLAFEQGMAAVWDLHQAHGLWASAAQAPPAVQQVLKARFCSVSPQGYVHGDAALAGRRNTLPELAGFAGPALVICGEHEARALTAIADQLAAALPRARRETIAGAWHSPQWENAAAFNDVLLDFLNSL